MKDLFGNVPEVAKQSDQLSIKELSQYKEIKHETVKKYDDSFGIKELFGYSDLLEIYLQKFVANKLHHAHIISGNYSVGKATFVYNLITKCLLSKAENNHEAQLNMLENVIHPDVYILSKSDILIEDIRQLLNFITLKPIYGYKFIIIDSIDNMNINCMNALLKTLEEPTDNTFFFIINHNFKPLLDTIYSRCIEQQINYTLSKEDFKALVDSLCSSKLSDNEMDFYQNISHSSVGIAILMIKLNIFQFYQSIINNVYNEYSLYQSILSYINNQSIEIDNNNIKLLIVEKIAYYIIISLSQSQSSNTKILQLIRNIDDNLLKAKKYLISS